MTQFLDAVRRAAEQTTGYITQEVRERARYSGWDDDIVEGLRVEVNKSSFSAVVDEELADRAFIAEYGDPENRPTAVLRKYSENSVEATQLLVDQAMKNLEELL